MHEYLINPHSEKLIDGLVKNSPRAVMLYGPKGSAKLHVSRMLLRRINPNIDIQVFEALPGKTVGVDMIKEIRSFLKTKNSSIPDRAAIILPADKMTIEAQNALLKTLEEPTTGSIIMLLARSKSPILPTVLSRVQKVEMLPVSLEAAINHYRNYDEAAIKKAVFMSGGAAETLDKILREEDDTIRASFDTAKRFLSGSRFEKLKMIEQEKESAEELLENLMHIIKTAIQNEDLSGDARKRFARTFTLIADAQEKLGAHVSRKSVLLELALQV